MKLRSKFVIVVGGGRFGLRAAGFAKESKAKVVIIDKNAECQASRLATSIIKDGDLGRIQRMDEGETALFVHDGIDLLLQLIELSSPDYVSSATDYVSPAIPGHLIGMLVKKWFEKRGSKLKGESRILDAILEGLPDSIVLDVDREKSRVTMSYMPRELKCPIPCPHPEEFCFITKKPKMGPVYRILESATSKTVDISKIFISHQLGPGVGAIRGEEISDMLELFKQLHPPYNIAVGTACECHGILNAFQIT
jgi:hypothetical protein